MTPNEVIRSLVADDFDSLAARIYAVADTSADPKIIESMIVAAKTLLLGNPAASPKPVIASNDNYSKIQSAAAKLGLTNGTIPASTDGEADDQPEFADVNDLCEICLGPYGAHATDKKYPEVDTYRVVTLCLDNRKVYVSGEPSIDLDRR